MLNKKNSNILPLIEDDIIYKSIKINNYANAAERLLNLQLELRVQLKQGYDSLSSIKTKNIWFNGFKISLQFNPVRIKSTSAKTDDESIGNRKCFLCIENLPAEQKAIEIRGNYLILCNPFPIFPEHFTIASIEHQPQEILSSFDDLIMVTKLLSGKYSVIYNGPKCGASAPDHLHFQAGTKNFMPVENEFNYLKNEYGEILTENSSLKISAINDGLRKFIGIESKDPKILSETFRVFYDIYSSFNSTKEEPLMNIISTFDDKIGWKVMLFLRRKHRSSHYFLEGDKQIMISPAAVDLGGLCITPVEKNYNTVDKEIIVEIFSEVSLFKEGFVYLKSALKKYFSG